MLQEGDSVFDDKMHAAVLLPAGGIVLEAQRTVFPEARHFNLEGFQPQILKITLDASRSPFAEHQIIFHRSDFVGAALQKNLCHAVGLEPLGVFLDGGQGIVAQDILIEIEEHVGEGNVL